MASMAHAPGTRADGTESECTRCEMVPLWTHQLDGFAPDPETCYPPLCLECGEGDLAVEACFNARDLGLCVECCGEEH